jgi:hypothetical protein
MPSVTYLVSWGLDDDNGTKLKQNIIQIRPMLKYYCFHYTKLKCVQVNPKQYKYVQNSNISVNNLDLVGASYQGLIATSLACKTNSFSVFLDGSV